MITVATDHDLTSLDMKR